MEFAAETIKKCEVLAVPARTREQAVSYQIAGGLACLTGHMSFSQFP